MEDENNEEFDDGSFVPMDPGDSTRGDSATDFANTMLDKSEFIKTLPPQFRPMMRMIERNIALSHLLERDLPKMRSTIDEMQNLFLSTMSPRYCTPTTILNLQMIKTVSELDARRALNANERGWFAEQYHYSGTMHTITRDDDSGGGGFWPKLFGFSKRR